MLLSKVLPLSQSPEERGGGKFSKFVSSYLSRNLSKENSLLPLSLLGGKERDQCKCNAEVYLFGGEGKEERAESLMKCSKGIYTANSRTSDSKM